MILSSLTFSHLKPQVFFCGNIARFCFLDGSQIVDDKTSTNRVCVTRPLFFWGAGQTSCFMNKNEGNQVVVCDVSGVKYSKP